LDSRTKQSSVFGVTNKAFKKVDLKQKHPNFNEHIMKELQRKTNVQTSFSKLQNLNEKTIQSDGNFVKSVITSFSSQSELQSI
jgi:hypothetical protein